MILDRSNIMDIENKEERAEERVVELSVNEVNNLTIDQLLDFKVQNVKIRVPDISYHIKWNKDGLDLDKEREELIINAISTLQLKLKLENTGHKYYNESFNEITKLVKNVEHKDLLQSILGINLEETSSKEEDKNKSTGLIDVFSLITKINKNSSRLSTLGGKTDYIVEKLNITDLTELIFVVLALDASED